MHSRISHRRIKVSQPSVCIVVCRYRFSISTSSGTSVRGTWRAVVYRDRNVENSHWQDDTSLVIAGDGLLRKQIEQRSVSCLEYLGNIPYESVPPLGSASLAGLCLNNDRGRSQIGVSPLKLYEYTAYGRPVIVTDLPGLSDFISDAGCGLIISCDDPIALCEAVRQLLEDPQKREAKGKAGAAYVRSGFSWQDRAKETLGILRKVAE